MIWLFLFGSLFRKVVELPGFGAPSYLDYLVPGVVIMSALSTSMWSGMTVLEEIDRGIMDRFLVLPLHRSAIINASVVMQALIDHGAVGHHRGARLGGGRALPGRRRPASLVLIAASVLLAHRVQRASPTRSACWPGSGRRSSASTRSCCCR